MRLHLINNMVKHFLHSISFVLLSFLLFSCKVEDLVPSGGDSLQEGEGWVYLDFNAASTVKVNTKFFLSSEENNVYNIFVFVFNSAGKKVYSKWFTSAEALSGESAVLAAKGDAWWVTNYTDATSLAKGGLKVKSTAGKDLKIYLITNLDADMVKVSSDLLSYSIDTEDDLKNFKLYMNVESLNRNGLFPMTGSITGVTVDDTGDGSVNKVNTSSSPVVLERVDSKVKFIFKKGTRADEKGQTIQTFTPSQWKVVNIPNTSYLIPRSEDAVMAPIDLQNSEYSEYASHFFESDWKNFENVSASESDFSFYIMENRQTPKNTSFISYNDRSRQKKTAAGLNDKVQVDYYNYLGKPVSKEMLLFDNANDFSTYVLVKGTVTMDLVDDSAGQVLGADVQYLIHLGNWSFTEGSKWSEDTYSGVTNFNTERNTYYTYTVTVNSVNNIRVEVETSSDTGGSKENQPGASGEVTIAKEEIALCDAHYVSKTLSFHASNFILKGSDGSYSSTADSLTWRVVTPFNPKGGTPVIVDGVTVADHLDYKWAHFRLNMQDDTGVYYSEKRRCYVPYEFATSETMRVNTDPDGTAGLNGYHNDGIMDVIYLVRYMKEQVKLYVDYLNELRVNPSAVNKSAFDSSSEPKISLTVFVDEYYYDEDPISHTTSPTLWKKFVNQDDRHLHILCESKTSTDTESMATGSVVTIRQKSIKSIYNTSEDYTELTSAWGLECDDEVSDVIKYYNTGSDDASTSGNNTSLYNGRANSVFEWGLAPSGVSVTTIDDISSGKKWKTYMNYEVNNDTPQMMDDYKSLRYYCMSRNRDNNGDGIISRDELRWYMASSMQITGIIIGNGLLSQSIRLYNVSSDQKVSGGKWKKMVLASTKFNGASGPLVIWAHEGLSTSTYSQARSWVSGETYTTRCVRNLGMDADAPIKDEPQNYVEVKKQTSTEGSYYSITCTHLNESALRDYTSRELSYQNEWAPTNLLYKRFETSPTMLTLSAEVKGLDNLNDQITAAANGSSVSLGLCPEGYRLPSQLELAVMLNSGVLDSSTYDSWNLPTRTYYSLGPHEYNVDDSHKQGFWVTGASKMTVGNANTTSFGTARCVKDVRVE